MAENTDPAAEFAKLMSAAAADVQKDAGKDPDPAPYGYMKDPVTGEQRPRKRPGRAGKKAAQPESKPGGSDDYQPPADKDPAPAWGKKEDEPGKKKLKIEDVPQQVVDDIAGLAGLVATPILSLLQSADPYCGTILAQNFGPVLDATLPIICRSEKIVKYFSEDKADWLIWGKLAMALAPVAKAIFEHHIAHTVEVRRDPATGQVQIVRPQRGQEGDHLQPPVQGEPNYNYAA